MKKCIALVALLALPSSGAFAKGKYSAVADPVVVPPVVYGPSPNFSWAGLYGGVLLGYGLGNSRHCEGPDCNLGGPHFATPSSNGPMGGLTLGYNFQHGNLVYGVEFDHAFARMKGHVGSTASFDCGVAGGCRTMIHSMTTLRARLGVAQDRTLIYGTAGVSRVAGRGGVNGISPDGKFWTLAPVVGLGVEHAVSDRISLKAEILHTYPTGPYVLQPLVCTAPGCGIDRIYVTTARLGMNVRF